MSGEFRDYLLEKLARNAHLYNKFDRILEETGMSPRTRRLACAPLTDEDFAIMAKGYRDTPILPGTPIRDPLWSGVLMGIAAWSLDRDGSLMWRAQGSSRHYRELWLPSTLWTEIRGAPYREAKT